MGETKLLINILLDVIWIQALLIALLVATRNDPERAGEAK